MVALSGYHWHLFYVSGDHPALDTKLTSQYETVYTVRVTRSWSFRRLRYGHPTRTHTADCGMGNPTLSLILKLALNVNHDQS